MLKQHLWATREHHASDGNRFALHGDIGDTEIGFLKKGQDPSLTVWLIQQLKRQSCIKRRGASNHNKALLEPEKNREKLGVV
jgi:hypothetical protein